MSKRAVKSLFLFGDHVCSLFASELRSTLWQPAIDLQTVDNSTTQAINASV
jgi:hypothetical protein